MFVLLITLLCLGMGALSASLDEEQYQLLFLKFVQTFQKRYRIEEIIVKYHTFKSNLNLIIAHNAQNGQTWKMGVNQFTDLTSEEFAKMMGFRPLPTPIISPDEVPCESLLDDDEVSFANPNGYINWVKLGKVSPIQNQGQCGSCWAFSAVAGLESVLAIQTESEVIKLSEEQAVQCSVSNSACGGGLMENLYQDIINNKLGKKGLCRESDYYPYSATKKACQIDKCDGVVRVKEYCRMPTPRGGETDDDIWVSLINKAPITIGLIASSTQFQMYASGILNNCPETKLHDHAVVITGFGKDPKGGKFWQIRNSVVLLMLFQVSYLD